MSTEQWEREYTDGYRKFRAELCGDSYEIKPTIYRKYEKTIDGKKVIITKDLVSQTIVSIDNLSDEEAKGERQ